MRGFQLKLQLLQWARIFPVMMKRSRVIRWTFFLSLFFIILTIILPLSRIVPEVDEKPFLPLHYNIYFGVDRFGPWYHLFFVPLIGCGVFLFNLVLHIHLFEQEAFLSRLISVVTLLIEVALFASMIFIVLFNL